MFVAYFCGSRKPRIYTLKPIIYESFDAEVDSKAFNLPIVKCEGLNNVLKKGEYRFLCSDF